MNRSMRMFFMALIIIGAITKSFAAHETKPLRISLTISAKSNHLEVTWFHAKPPIGTILVTDEVPTGPYVKYETLTTATTTANVNKEDSPNTETISTTIQPDYSDTTVESLHIPAPAIKKTVWTYGVNNRTALAAIQPDEENGWITTQLPFDNELSKSVTVHTRCYGYWAIYIDNDGNTLATACISAQPAWMNDMRDHIKNFRFCNLFIVGSHDSGSFRSNYNPHGHDSIVTKYSLTQSDDITGQLMHGIRYLDIRVGYYRSVEPRFWVNHGITRQQPLDKVLRQVRDFVLETNEIVIFDVQEFPVGFGKKIDVHRRLVQYIQSEIGELMADPTMGWEATLDSIWRTKRNIIVSYDHIGVLQEFPSLLWRSVQQRWGNVQTIPDLRKHLVPVVLFSSRPVADMAEMTPTGWDLITDRLGGLRKMADQTNRHVSKWYLDDWGPLANVVAVDFYKGTNLVDTSIYWNRKKELLQPIN